MDKLKAHYDRVLLVAAGIVLLAVALYAALNASSLRDEFPVPPVRDTGAGFEEDPVLARLQTEAAKLQEPSRSAWAADDRALFVSRVYLLREGQLVDILESDVELYPGIPNAWILKHGLDYTDRNLALADPDNDGFNNVEEFRAGTNPMDANSKPASWSKLRLTASKIDKLRTKFESLPRGDLKVVQINTVSADNPRALTGASQFYTEGDMIKLSETGPDGKQLETDTPLKFVEATFIKRPNPATNSEEEIPQITLLNTTDGVKIELLQGEVKDSPYSLASLQDTRSGQTTELRSGQEFELEPGQRYKLIDVSEEAATIQDLTSGEKHTIPRPETDALPAPPSE